MKKLWLLLLIQGLITGSLFGASKVAIPSFGQSRANLATKIENKYKKLGTVLQASEAEMKKMGFALTGHETIDELDKELKEVKKVITQYKNNPKAAKKLKRGLEILSTFSSTQKGMRRTAILFLSLVGLILLGLVGLGIWALTRIHRK